MAINTNLNNRPYGQMDYSFNPAMPSIMNSGGYNTAPYNQTPFPVQGAPANPGFTQPAQQMPNIPITVFPGRIVNDITDIKPNEIPMDGTVSLFPKSDYTCIYAKTWDQNGNLLTYKFIPEPQTQPGENQNGSFRFEDAVMAKLDAMEGVLNNLAAPRNNSPHYNKNNKRIERNNTNEPNATDASQHGTTAEPSTSKQPAGNGNY